MPDDLIVFEDGADGIEFRRGAAGSVLIEGDGPDGECGITLDRGEVGKLIAWLIAARGHGAA